MGNEAHHVVCVVVVWRIRHRRVSANTGRLKSAGPHDEGGFDQRDLDASGDDGLAAGDAEFDGGDMIMMQEA